MKPNRNLAQCFKQPGAFEMFDNYVQRLKPQTATEILSPKFEDLVKRPSGEILWLCERSHKNAKQLSSEELSLQIDKLQQAGVKKLWFVVGPADGFNKEQISELRADFMWSFGPATYPHELATIVMTEQIYRAYMILAGHPYHVGH